MQKEKNEKRNKNDEKEPKKNRKESKETNLYIKLYSRNAVTVWAGDVECRMRMSVAYTLRITLTMSV